jgi:hypothetical protein
MYLQLNTEKNTISSNYSPLFIENKETKNEKENDHLSFFKENKCDFNECPGCKDCSSPEPNPFEIAMYVSRDGQILDVNVEVVWYEISLGQYDEIRRTSRLFLYRNSRCGYIRLPAGNSRCCYTINAVRGTDPYVRSSINIPNSVKYPKYINIIVEKSGDDISFEITEKPDICITNTGVKIC